MSEDDIEVEHELDRAGFAELGCDACKIILLTARAEQAERERDEARAVLEYVSRGRRYVDVEPYPDATARRILGAIGADKDVTRP